MSLELDGEKIRKSKNLNFIKEVLQMSELVQRPFEEVLEEAIIANCLEQFEEATLERGREEGREESREREELLISKLLENYDPEELSKEFDIPLERILEIKNSK